MKRQKAVVAVVAFLVFGGVGASLLRTVDILQRKPGPLQITPKDQFSIDLLSRMGSTDARSDVVNFEKRYADHPKPILLHVLAGGAFLLLAGLQFSKTIRNRYRAFHRWSGRFLLVCIVGINLSALYYGIGMPYAGLSEMNVTVLIGMWMLYTAARAYLAIRRRDIQTHRAFMTRTFATAIGISVARVVSIPLTWMLHGFHNAFGPSLWLGFGLSILGGEVWLRATRSEVAVPNGIQKMKTVPNTPCRQ